MATPNALLPPGNNSFNLPWTLSAPLQGPSSSIVPVYASSLLSLHMNGPDASTVFTDSSVSPKTLTTNGGAKISTAQSLFGGSSGSFTPGTLDYLSVTNAAFATGTGDFTVQTYVRFTSSLVKAGFISSRHSATGVGIQLGLEDGLRPIIAVGNGSGVSGVDYINSPIQPPLNQWIHMAGVRWNGVLYLYVGGKNNGLTIPTSRSVNLTNMVIGRYWPDLSSNYFSGNLQETHFHNYAMYTSDFTPPPMAFPDA